MQGFPKCRNSRLRHNSPGMLETFLKLLVMLLATNGAPVVATRVDLGRKLDDGYPIFGSSKTWRGLFSALATSGVLAILFGFGPSFGLVFGMLVMAGDLFSSFVKRRRRLEPGARSVGLDQVPEALLPSLYTVFSLGIAWWWSVLLTLAFLLVQMLISRPLYWLSIRKNPH